MSTEREYTIEELEAQYKLTEESQKALKQQIEQRKNKEREIRKKELDEALKKFETLLKAYIDDYGIYSYTDDENIFDLFSSKFWNNIF